VGPAVGRPDRRRVDPKRTIVRLQAQKVHETVLERGRPEPRAPPPSPPSLPHHAVRKPSGGCSGPGLWCQTGFYPGEVAGGWYEVAERRHRAVRVTAHATTAGYFGISHATAQRRRRLR